MKTCTKAMMLGLALLSPVVLRAEPAAPPAAGAGQQAGDFRAEHEQKRLDQLHKALMLTADQEVDWKTWSDQVSAVKKQRKQARPDWQALKKLPAPERLEKMIEFGKVRLATMETLLDATRNFYGKLGQEQRKTFDDLTPLGGHAPHWHGKGHGHWPCMEAK